MVEALPKGSIIWTDHWLTRRRRVHAAYDHDRNLIAASLALDQLLKQLADAGDTVLNVVGHDWRITIEIKEIARTPLSFSAAPVVQGPNPAKYDNLSAVSNSPTLKKAE